MNLSPRTGRTRFGLAGLVLALLASLLTAAPAQAAGLSGASVSGAVVELGESSICDYSGSNRVTKAVVRWQTSSGRIVKAVTLTATDGRLGERRITDLAPGTYFMSYECFYVKGDSRLSMMVRTDVKSGKTVDATVCCRRAWGTASGTVTAYGFQVPVTGTVLGEVQVYLEVDGGYVRAPQSAVHAAPLTRNGERSWSFTTTTTTGSIAVSFGGAAARQWTGDGTVARQWYPNAATLNAAQKIPFEPDGYGRKGANGTIRPVNWTPTDTGFVDVDSRESRPEFSSFAEAISWLAGRNITTGWTLADGAKVFRPGERITREAMAAFLYRAAGSPEFEAPATPPFVDATPTSTEYSREIAWLASQGISAGWTTSKGQEFRPKAPVSREAMAAFLYRAAGSPDVEAATEPSFVDVDADSSEFTDAITWLASEGISTGWATDAGQEFRPSAKITRDAMAAFLFRADADQD